MENLLTSCVPNVEGDSFVVEVYLLVHERCLHRRQVVLVELVMNESQQDRRLSDFPFTAKK